MLIYVTNSILDIYTGLALEQCLFSIQQNHPLLFFWQSSPAVVIGRNQNPWQESNLLLMKSDGVSLARRDSGGGTVYHDEQNMNICVVSHQLKMQVERNLDCFKDLLQNLGLPVERSPEHNLMREGKKISGSAMRYAEKKLLHHFTLLLSPDNEYIASILRSPPQIDIKTMGVQSKPAITTGTQLAYEQVLNEFIQDPSYAQRLQSYQDFHSTGRESNTVIHIESIPAFLTQHSLSKDFKKQRKRLMSKNWLYARSPSFVLTLAVTDKAGKAIKYHLKCQKGRIGEIKDGSTTLFLAQNVEEEIALDPVALLQFLKSSKNAILKEIIKTLFQAYYGELNEYTY